MPRKWRLRDKLDPNSTTFAQRDCSWKFPGKEHRADRAGCPGKRCDAVPGDLQLQPRRGGALLADHGVARRSLCKGISLRSRKRSR